MAKESSGSVHNLKAKREYLIDISGMVMDSQLAITFQYSNKFHKDDSIQKLSSFYLDALKNIIAHCLSPEAGGYTPSDFELANLSQKELDEIIQESHHN